MNTPHIKCDAMWLGLKKRCNTMFELEYLRDIWYYCASKERLIELPSTPWNDEIRRTIQYLRTHMKNGEMLHYTVHLIKESLEKLGTLGYPQEKINEIAEQFEKPVEERILLPEIYEDTQKDRRVLELLERIKDVYSIPYKVRLVGSAYRIREARNKGFDVEIEMEDRIYKKELKPRFRILASRGRPIARHLKSRSGNISISTTLLIKRDEQIEYYEYWFDDIIAFLSKLLSNGVSLLESLITKPKKTDLHTKLLDELDNSEILGKLNRGVPIGSRIFDDDIWKSGSKFDWRKEIDAIGKREDSTYVIESKPKLDHNNGFKAIGQVYVYEYLYKKVHPKEKVKKAIVCKDIRDDELLAFCIENDILVFELTDNGIKEYKSNNSK